MKSKVSPPELSDIELEAIRRLDAMSDEDIDTSDIPEQRDWTDGVRGKFHDPHARRVVRKRHAHPADEVRK